MINNDKRMISIGTQLMVDMGNCSSSYHKIEYIEKFCDYIMNTYKLDIMCKHVEKFEDDLGSIVALVFQDAQQLTIRSYVRNNNKILVDVYLLDLSMKKIEMLKEEILRTFEPRIYRASMKPRGYVTDSK